MPPKYKPNQLMVLKQQKLKDLEKSLSKIMNTLDREINQTDVEWLNLKSVILASASKDLTEKIDVTELKPNIEIQTRNHMLTSVKPEPWLTQQLDDLAVNNLDLDLSVDDFNKRSLEEESDSD